MNASNFETLEQVLVFIESEILHKDIFYIITFLMRYKDRTDDEEEKQKLQWELDFLHFDIKGNKIEPLSSAYKDGNEINKYPDLKLIETRAFDYLMSRVSSTQSPIFLARYSHLLWKLPNEIKKRDFAVSAIDYYVQSVKLCMTGLAEDINNDLAYKIGEFFEIAISLCSEVNCESGELKSLVKLLLFDSPDVTMFIKQAILEDMVAHPKLFKKNDFANVLTIYENELNNPDKDDFVLVNYWLPLAIKIAQKTNSNVKKWHQEIGLAHLRMAEKETEEDRNWLKAEAYKKAINAFGLAGDKVQKTEVERKYYELKPKIKLSSIDITFDEERNKLLFQLQRQIEAETNSMLLNHPFQIYSFISKGEFFQKAKKIIEESTKDAFSNFCTTIVFDSNKNISKGSMNDEYSTETYFLYSFQINHSALTYLHFLFFNGIKKGRLTIKNLLDFLIAKSWIAKPYSKTDLGGNNAELNALDLIAPSIVEYFNQVQAWTSSKFFAPNFVLCIDSLALKIEMVLRSFAERVGVPTSVGRKEGMEEKYTHEILNNELIKPYFTDDDRLFFSFLFSNSGLNLRNKIAHSFCTPNEYTHDKMLLLLSAFLRIAAINLEVNE